MLRFEESKGGYRTRTIENAKASDITIAFAYDFTTPGEVLTKTAVKENNKIYIPVDLKNLSSDDDRIKKVLSKFNLSDYTIKTSISQLLVSGVEKFGTLQYIREDINLIGEPTSFNLIKQGFRTRTTRAKTEYLSYNIKVGDYVFMYGLDRQKCVCQITDIYDRSDERFIKNWYKEGWTDEGINRLERFNDPYAIEFKLIERPNVIVNIAGNGMYSLQKYGFTQEKLDKFIYTFLSKLFIKSSNNITLVRSGGQTGVDESGIKAALKLDKEALVLAPNKWMYRDLNNIDIKDEIKFKERFYGEVK